MRREGGTWSTTIAMVVLAALPSMARAQASTSINVDPTGRVGIGTSTPVAPLHVWREGDAQVMVTDTSATTLARNLFVIENKGNTTFIIRDNTPDDPNEPGISSWQLGNLSHSSIDGFVISRQGDGYNEFIVKDNGDVHVAKSVYASHFIDTSAPAPWPDHVLAPGYPLMSLADLASYVEREGHLPNVPSASQVARDGLDLSEFQMRLLEKIEELTLHVIAQDGAIRELRERLENGAAPGSREVASPGERVP